MNSRYSVRKRVAAPSKIMSPPLIGPRINPRLIYDDYAKLQKGPASIGIRIRNCILIIIMLLFPLFIFVSSMFNQRSDYPRVVVAVRTANNRLASLEPLITNLRQEKLAVLYLVMVGTDSESHEFPEFLKVLMDGLESTTKGPRLQILYSGTEEESTLSFVAALVVQSEYEAVNVVEVKEEGLDSSNERQATISDITTDETRVVIINDDPSTPTISSLIRESLKEPDAVLSVAGGSWRSNFRQVKAATQSSDIDRFPNIVIHRSDANGRQEDVLDSSEGIIFREALLEPLLPAMGQKLSDLSVDVSSQIIDTVLMEPEAEDVVWSALLETFNVTRRIVPSGYDVRRNTNNITKRTYSSGHWMNAAFQLQRRWKVWQDYTFMDWLSFSPDQKNRIVCEGLHDQICNTEICRPNPVYCGNDTQSLPVEKMMTDPSG